MQTWKLERKRIQNIIDLLSMFNKNIAQTDGLASNDYTESIEAGPSKKDMGSNSSQFWRHEFLAAPNNYMNDVEEPIQAFAFINNTLMQVSNGDYIAVIS
ncbi:hypothetical protein PVK06_023804 [Gossypium arboreum]|uniref:Uncharacterized protein n=1 Tax=Gossypium arboreum TaxID=29729 RepID=A0ABR0PC49_GOSAR|nr:hypothetical protein PVK06_023804 [Gossypium arboreum]